MIQGERTIQDSSRLYTATQRLHRNSTGSIRQHSRNVQAVAPFRLQSLRSLISLVHAQTLVFVAEDDVRRKRIGCSESARTIR